MITSGLPRTLETAAIVAPAANAEAWPELREIQGGRISRSPEALSRVRARVSRRHPERRRDSCAASRSASSSIRVLPALERRLAETSWNTALAVLHGGVNRAILSYALTGERMFLGHFEQAPACVNVLDLGEGGEWIVRAVNVAPYDLLHLAIARRRWSATGSSTNALRMSRRTGSDREAVAFRVWAGRNRVRGRP